MTQLPSVPPRSYGQPLVARRLAPVLGARGWGGAVVSNRAVPAVTPLRKVPVIIADPK